MRFIFQGIYFNGAPLQRSEFMASARRSCPGVGVQVSAGTGFSGNRIQRVQVSAGAGFTGNMVQRVQSGVTWARTAEILSVKSPVADDDTLPQRHPLSR